MADVIQFHEYKLDAFKRHLEESKKNLEFIEDLRRKSSYNPGLKDILQKAEQLSQQDRGTSSSFIRTIIANLKSGRQEMNMSSWRASPNAPNAARQQQLERSAMEFYQFCVTNGFERECRESGLDFSHNQPPSQPYRASVSVPPPVQVKEASPFTLPAPIPTPTPTPPPTPIQTVEPMDSPLTLSDEDFDLTIQ